MNSKLIVEFEKHEVVKEFMDIFDVYHTNLGGYRYSKDDSPCYNLNGMLTMFEEQQKKIESLLDYVDGAGHTPNWIIKEFLK